ncbi:MAG: polysaccharide pyruvyl transferase family protein [Lachnospiraceae bacterium]|nr:polysaccharide pyruvyl transferase family protein [Lachnospiraceae bacterium]
MKIGLLTTYSFNYGSYHQAVALQKKLEDMGHDCELINEKIKMYKWMNLFFMYTFDPILPNFIKNIIGKKIPQYNSFRMIKNDTKDLNVSPANIKKIKKLSERYDCIVIGSDELWSASTDSIRFCPEYFGIGWDIPLISYATCAIKLTSIDDKMASDIKRGLSGFTAISVRDVKSLENVKKIVPELSVETVIDPTLLNPYFVPENVKEAKDRYVLLYGQHFDDAQRKYIIEYAKKENAKICCVGWNQDWADEFMNVTTAKELQETFATASFCFPSTFHGTIFSILNHKQFVAMLNPLRGGKVKLLLELLKLDNRIFCNDMREIDKIDYDEVEDKINELRKKSEEYLVNALQEVSKGVRK